MIQRKSGIWARNVDTGNLTIPLSFTAHIILALILAWTPLFDLLSYEYSLAVSVLAALTSPFIGLWASRSKTYLPQIFVTAFFTAIAQLLPGLIIISLNALRVRNCDFLEGLAFFALLPLMSALWGATLGILTGQLLPNARKWVLVLILLLLIFTPLFFILWALYSEPQIFIYDHLFGYFAGAIYDESVSTTTTLLLFRLGTLLRILGAIVFIAMLRSQPSGKILRSSITLLIVVTLSLSFEIFAGEKAGFRAGQTIIEKALPVRIERSGLVIHLPSGLSKKQIQAIGDDHAFHLDRLVKAFGVKPNFTIHSYVYRTKEDKARLMGGRNTQFAKPWLHQIHIHGIGTPHSVMPHELAHAVAGAFGSEPLLVSARYLIGVNMGIIEGVAEAVTTSAQRSDIHHQARAMRSLKIAPNIRKIVGPRGFLTSSPRRAYTIAGSFIRYLLEHYGSEKLRVLYPHGEFKEAYGKSLHALALEWESFVDQIEIEREEKRSAKERFRLPSIFEKPCAHTIANLRRKSARASATEAIEIENIICAHLGSPPSCRISRARAWLKAEDSAAFLQEVGELLRSGYLNGIQEAGLLHQRGDYYWKTGKIEDAKEDYQNALNLKSGTHAERLLWTKLWAIKQENIRADILRRFLTRELKPVAAVAAMVEMQTQ
ncbi:hypothetical protein KAI87_05685, partial [Myxococcota bacterium]|nr:hypothetical protein [Myxococcota bacterium]